MSSGNMMDDLIAFITARLDEDEAAAKAWQSPPWREDATNWKVVGRREPRYDNGRSETLTVIDVSGRPVDFAEAIQVKWDSNGERAEHIARHDPARVLREVKAKRSVLWWCGGRVNELDQPPNGLVSPRAVLARQALMELGTVWSDHADYRAEWQTGVRQ